jgi:hypothetical protein
MKIQQPKLSRDREGAVLKRAEKLAKRANKSRSQLFAKAMDRLCASMPDSSDEFVFAAVHCVLERSEW